jgi:MFS family permease
MLDKSILIIMAVLLLSNTIYGLASPFLPRLFVERNIAESWTGFIFACYAIAYSIMAPIVGMIIDKATHKFIMILGILLMSTSIASFGFTTYIASNSCLLGTAAVLRIC